MKKAHDTKDIKKNKNNTCFPVKNDLSNISDAEHWHLQIL